MYVLCATGLACETLLLKTRARYLHFCSKELLRMKVQEVHMINSVMEKQNVSPVVKTIANALPCKRTVRN